MFFVFVFQTFLETIIKDSVLYAENGRRKMVTEQDVDCSLRKNGIKIYGIEGNCMVVYDLFEILNLNEFYKILMVNTDMPGQ